MAKEFLDLPGLTVYDEEIKNYIKNYPFTDTNVVQESTYLNFPSVGSQNVIYIDTTTNQIYRWDDTEAKYYSVVENYSNIRVINGCALS